MAVDLAIIERGGIEVINYNYGFAYFSFQFHQFLSHMFYSSVVWCIRTWTCHVWWVDPFYNYPVSLPVAGKFLCSEAYFIGY